MTMNMTWKDLNIETVRLLREALLKENLKKPRNELEVYISGPCFPCGDHNLKKRSLRKNSKSKAFEGVTSFTENIDSVVCFKNGLGKHSRYFEKNEMDVKFLENGFTQDALKDHKDRTTTNARSFQKKPEYISIEENAELTSLDSIKTPTLDVGNCDGAVASPISSGSATQLHGSDYDFTNDGRILKSEKRSSVEVMIKRDNLNETECVERKKAEVVGSHSLNKTKTPALCLIDETEQKQTSKLSKKEQNVFSIVEECLRQGTNNVSRNTELFYGQRNQLTSAIKSRKPSCQLDVILSRGTSPLLERRHERRLSRKDNENTTSRNSLNNKYFSTTGRFSLEKISNPLLRESLQKILNAQHRVENFEVKPEITARDETVPSLIAKENRTDLLEEQQSLFPNIKDRLKHNSFDDWYQRTRSLPNDEFHRKKRTKLVRFEESKPSRDICSTKCAGIVVRRSHPVHMISVTPEYAVKGLIGHWLKRHSGNTVGVRDTPNVEKQERFREVQLLKVGLSMRMLAGMV